MNPRTRQFRILDREKEIVRLGSGSADMKYLSRPAIDRGIVALRRFCRIAEAFDAPVRALATSAVREALNRDEFLRRVRNETGIRIEVASGIEESRLIYLGVLQALPVFSRKVLCIDIGGGSTEYLLGRRKNVISTNSVKLGALRLTHMFFPDGKTGSRSIRECRRYIRGMLTPIVRQTTLHEPFTAVGSSGTIQNIARIIRAYRGDPFDGSLNNTQFGAGELEEVVDLICSKDTPEERLSIEGLDPSRSDIITAGALILRQSFREFGLKSMRVSEYALREGILYDTMEKRQNGHESDHLKNIRFNSILNLSSTFNNEIRHGRQVAKLALSIFDQTAPLHDLGGREREFLEAAALLHEIGLFVSHDQHHRHTYYIIRNAELMGFTEDEKEIIANVARYHRKSHPKLKHEGFSALSEDDQETVRKLAGILRIADGLDRSHRSNVGSVRVSRRGEHLRFDLTAHRHANLDLEIWGVELKKGLFEDTFDVRLRMRALPVRRK